MSLVVRKPKCCNCAERLIPSGSIPQKAHGVLLHAGIRYCMVGKRPRSFKRSDPQVYVPRWCPKRKRPAEFRIYGFKDTDQQWMHYSLVRNFGYACAAPHRYVRYHEGHTDMDACQFAKLAKRPAEIACTLGCVIERYHIVEIDDGIAPACFYLTEKGYSAIPFDTAGPKQRKHETISEEE